MVAARTSFLIAALGLMMFPAHGLRAESPPVQRWSAAGFGPFTDRLRTSPVGTVTLLEGLPHQLVEHASFLQERKTRDTVEVGGYFFYKSALPLTTDDAAALRAMCLSPGSYAPFSGPKRCGGFHPDYALRWGEGKDALYTLICLGCHETQTLDREKCLLADLPEPAFRLFQGRLDRYHSQRPLSKKARVMAISDFLPGEFLDLTRTIHGELFDPGLPVWFALPKIAPYLRASLKPAMLGRRLGTPYIGDQVFIGENTVVEHGACVKGPAWIGANCEVRSGCYVRENVIVGDGAVLGNSCEFKNSVLFDGTQVPHFNYVGDSILGHKAHLGAGVILSNVKLDHAEILVETADGARLPTGLRKFGAILGDLAEVGCNAVLNPGSVIGRRSLVYPGAQWRGTLPAESIAQVRQSVNILARRPSR